jgi:hypothetical protein
VCAVKLSQQTRVFLFLSFLRCKLPLVTVTVLYSMLRRIWVIRSSLSLSLILGVGGRGLQDLIIIMLSLFFLLAEQTKQTAILVLWRLFGHTDTNLKSR